MSFSIRDQYRKRVLEEVILCSNKDSCIGTVLITDKETFQLLEFALLNSEVKEYGVTMTESIDNYRKAYPTFRALYLVSPTKENIDHIQRDFDKQPLYGALYIYTSRRLSDNDFKYLVSRSCIRKALALKEINIHYYIRSEFVYDLRQKDSIELQADGIMSVFSALNLVESVELCRIAGEKFTEAIKLEQLLEPRIKELVPIMKGSGEGYNVKIFLFDRAFDLLTPLIHDFYYESLLTDMLGIDLFNADGKGRVLNERDTVFVKFRYMFIKDFLTEVSSNFEKFLQENPTAQIQRKQQDKVKLEDMADAVSNMVEYKELIDQYNFHIEKIKEIVEKNDKENIKEVAEMETLLASGVDDRGEALDSGRRIDAAKKLISQTSDEFALRLALIAEGSLHRDCSSLKTLLSAESKMIFEKYHFLVEKYGKYWSDREKDKLKKISAGIYQQEDASLKRHIVKSQYLVEEYLTSGTRVDFTSKSFGETKFGAFGRAKDSLFKLKLNSYQPKSKNLILVYFTSGVSYAEIRAFKNMEKNLKTEVLVIGGNQIFTPKQFIQLYVNQ